MSDATEKYLIPQRLDDPPRFLWWDFDVAIVAMGMSCLGIMTGQLLTFTVAGFFIAGGYQRLKAGRHRAFGLHALYWYLPITFGFRVTPPSAVREFIG